MVRVYVYEVDIDQVVLLNIHWGVGNNRPIDMRVICLVPLGLGRVIDVRFLEQKGKGLKSPVWMLRRFGRMGRRMGLIRVGSGAEGK
jgi:hypothetical protein